MTATTETLEQEYDRLSNEHRELSSAGRKAGSLSAEGRQRFREVTLRLRELAAIPPEGYELPKLATDLIAHAKAHGWMVLVQWTSPSYVGQPFVGIQVGRQLGDEELPDARGRKWIYSLTWHSRGCAPGKVRLFGSGTAITPDQPAIHNGPSVKAIRAVIAQHPGVAS